MTSMLQKLEQLGVAPSTISYLLEHEVGFNYVLFGHINDIGQDLSDEDFLKHLLKILESVVFFHRKYLGMDGPKRVHEFHRDVDEIISKNLFGQAGHEIICSKGCSNCCSQQVFVTQSEARILAKHMTEDKVANVLKQSGLTDVTWTQNLSEPEARCVFLDIKDGSCQVWSQRPANCRNYFVTGTNEFCSVFKRDSERSRSLKSILADVCISAFYSVEGGILPLPDLLAVKTT